MGTLYENIESLCEERGISGGKMCSDLSISRSFLTDRRSGRKEGANIETIIKIADYFGVSLDRVVFGEEKGYGPTLSEVKKEFIDEIMNWPEEKVKALTEAARAFKLMENK